MSKKVNKKMASVEIWEEDVFDSFLAEMSELISKYPDDPNEIDLSERKLHELIKELDDSWMAFRRKWKNKLKDAEKIFGTALISKQKNGMRHLIIRSDLSGQDVLNLSITEKKKQK